MVPAAAQPFAGSTISASEVRRGGRGAASVTGSGFAVPLQLTPSFPSGCGDDGVGWDNGRCATSMGEGGAGEEGSESKTCVRGGSDAGVASVLTMSSFGTTDSCAWWCEGDLGALSAAGSGLHRLARRFTDIRRRSQSYAKGVSTVVSSLAEGAGLVNGMNAERAGATSATGSGFGFSVCLRLAP
jgi:hypothetical protein